MIFDDSHNVYIDIHFEQVYVSLYMSSSSLALKSTNNYRDVVKGIYQRALTKTVLNTIKKVVEYKKEYVFYFNMQYIEEFVGNADTLFLSFVEELSTFNKVYIYNIESKIKSKMKGLFSNKARCFTENEKDYYSLPLRDNVSEDFIRNIVPTADSAFNQDLVTTILNCCEKCNEDEQSPSSCVRLSNYINAKRLLFDFKKAFFFVYKLALVLERDGVLSISNKADNTDKIIFVHTMNSAVIGTILAQLFEINMIIVDHLGPYNKLFRDDLEKSIDHAKKYVVVADVVCMGTELSSARTLLDIFGASFCACATLVDIVPVGEKSPEEQKIHSLYLVNHFNNGEIKYTIHTDLE